MCMENARFQSVIQDVFMEPALLQELVCAILLAIGKARCAKSQIVGPRVILGMRDAMARLEHQCANVLTDSLEQTVARRIVLLDALAITGFVASTNHVNARPISTTNLVVSVNQSAAIAMTPTRNALLQAFVSVFLGTLKLDRPVRQYASLHVRQQNFASLQTHVHANQDTSALVKTVFRTALLHATRMKRV